LALTVSTTTSLQGGPDEQRPQELHLSDGSSTFYAALDDEFFKAAIDAGRESFRAGDMLRCRMEIIQSRGEDGTIHTERRVLKVVEHIARDVQMLLEPRGDDDDQVGGDVRSFA
jgi:hypothetical protein